MRKSFGSLIIFRPASPRIFRLHYTRRVVRLLIALAVIAIAGMLGARRVIPPPVPDAERARIARENEALKTQNKNLEIEAERLKFRVSQLEEMSKRMTEIAGAD
jgi:hypothetical protein